MKRRKLKKKNKKIFLLLIIILLLIFSILILNNNKNKNNIHTNKITTIIKETTIKQKENIKLTFVGDLLFEEPYYKSIEQGDKKEEYFSLVKDYFTNDDISIANMEVVIGNDNLKASGEGYNFCAPSWVGDLVNTLDLQVLSTANNHAYDREIDGINSTIDYFKNNTNILTVGTYKNEEEKNKIHYIEKGCMKIAFLSYTYGTNIKVPSKYQNNISIYRDTETKTFTKEKKAELKTEIEKAKNSSDFLIVIMHWGTEFSYTPNEEQKELATFLSELGVNLVIGSHSHSIEPIEKINNTYVFYSMGNFVSADNDISRTGEEFDNAYQFGLLASLEITPEKEITNLKTNIIVNYYDQNMRNFKLVPLNQYDKYEKTHYRYKQGLTTKFINDTYNKVIDSKYR